nr:MAG TPA: hypothetical protein [Caudoviricetes sp.]
MNKSALVIDTPGMCMGCPFTWPADDYTYICIVAVDADGDFKQIRDDSYAVKREDWYPLKSLPEKGTIENDMTDYQCGLIDGRNQCIDEITGGEVDD